MRLDVDGVVPLELWRLIMSDGSRFSRAIDRDANALLAGLDLLHRGEGDTGDGRTAHRACAGFRHLVVSGGGATAALEPVLARGPTPFTLRPDAFVAEAGGLDLARRLGYPPSEALVLDLGQTSIKVCYAGERHRLARDTARLPRGRLPSGQRDEQRRALREFLAEALARATDGRHPPRALVVGMPGEVAADATPGRSSYMGAAGDRDLLPDVLAQVHLAPEVVGVLNDAALAAASARLLPEVTDRTLVLTLGFGLGAALITTPATGPES